MYMCMCVCVYMCMSVCVCMCMSVCIYMYVCMAVDLRVVGLETNCVLIMWWLVTVLLWSVCSFMTDASDVANDSPPVVDCVVETRSGQRSPQVGVASAPEYFLHKKAHNRVTKLSFQRKCFPVGHRLRHCRRALLYAGSWNVHSLVKASGDCRICRARSTTHDRPGVERNLDLLVNELKHYSISIAGIQETKWFGSDICPVGEWTFLH